MFLSDFYNVSHELQKQFSQAPLPLTNDKDEASPTTKFQICTLWVLKKFETLKIYFWEKRLFDTDYF